MNNPLKILIQQIKDQNIDRQDAIKQLKALRRKQNGKIDSYVSPQEKGLDETELPKNKNELMVAIVEIFSNVLGVDRKDLQGKTTFKELGIGSINAVELVESVNAKFGLTLPTSVVFECSTLNSLREHIEEQLHINQWSRISLDYRPKPSTGVDVVDLEPKKHAPKIVCTQNEIHQTTCERKYNQKESDDIAIIGISCRCAGAKGQDDFWNIISGGRDSVTRIKNQTWHDFFAVHTSSRIPRRYGAMEDIEDFDPLFFNISPREAMAMDPAQRIVLEQAYSALEDAGYNPSTLRRKSVGTVIGTAAILPSGDFSHFSMLGSEASILASRLAFFLDLKGPALAINTACSSSLVAIDLAYKKLKIKEIDLALAGGVSICTHPALLIFMNNGGMMSPTEMCRPFDRAADGIVMGDGVGILVLKRLSDAERDHDAIYGIIKGSGTNQDGQTSGITVPSFLSQSELEESIYRENEIDVEKIQYIETHGTGTKLGDPVEIHALTHAFRKFTAKKRFCALGSLKANIGHTTAAAGVLSVIKILLCLKHKKIPPLANFSKQNEHIDFENSPFFVNIEQRDWEKEGYEPRMAAVSSFGFSGTNAHLVIEEYTPSIPTVAVKKQKKLPRLFLLSAKSHEGLRSYAERTRTFLQEHNSININDLLFTFLVGRESMSHRLAILADDPKELIHLLDEFIKDPTPQSSKRYYGESNKLKDIGIDDTDEGKEFIRKLFQHNKINKIAELWTAGLPIDWAGWIPVGTARRLSGLPTYPFAKEHYPVPGSVNITSEQKSMDPESNVLYPFVHKNTPNFETEGASPRLSEEDREIDDESDTYRQPAAGLTMLSAVWNSMVLPRETTVFPAVSSSVVIAGGTKKQRNVIQQVYPAGKYLEFQRQDTIEAIANRMKALALPDHVIWVGPDRPLKSPVDDVIIDDQNSGVLEVFRMVKAILMLGCGDKALGLTIITTQALIVYKRDIGNPTHASIHGLIGVLAKEYPQWKIRLIDLEARCKWPISEIVKMPPNHQGNAVAYRGGQWFEQTLIPVSQVAGNLSSYRSKGVYIVIGGAGGLGSIWSKFMIKNYQAQIIWIGRRRKDAKIQTKLDSMSKLGPEPLYFAADATDKEALQEAFEKIKQTHPQVHGVIHSAVGLFDQRVADMDETRFRDILSAKIDISVRIAQVFSKEALDFVLFFSSISSFLKAGGFSGYASGSTFEDAFALQLAKTWPCAVKVMNWGYWRIGTGMKIPEASKIRLEQSEVEPIAPHEGMAALEQLLTGPMNQLALMKSRKPLALENLKLNEWITSYCPAIPSLINALPKQIPNQDSPIEMIQSKRVLVHDKMEDLLVRLLGESLRSFGLLNDNDGYNSDGAQKVSLLGFYRSWLEESRNVLQKKKYIPLRRENGDLVAPSVALKTLWKEWDQAKIDWMRNSQQDPYLLLLEACLHGLPDILTGKRSATDIMFPNSSMELVEGIYNNNVVANYFNEALASMVTNYIHERVQVDSSTKIRILEIGAGTGGTTTILLPKLQQYRSQIKEYSYTDLSKSFLFHAHKHYVPQLPTMRTHIFDVEKPIASQDIRANHYDIIIATNVLHATRNISQTLRNAKATLRKNGLIFLNELSDKPLVAHLTFGLLEGWWLAEDTTLRIPGCPGLYPETWKKVLEEEGFNQVLFPVSTAHEFGQQIIVAQSDGLIRQRGSSPETPSPVNQPVSSINDSNESVRSVQSVLNEDRLSPDLLREKCTQYLKSVFGIALKLDPHKIDSAKPLESYGIDSILVVQITNTLREVFDDVSSTLFFEVQTIDALAKHFINTQKETLIQVLNLELEKTDLINPYHEEQTAPLPLTPTGAENRNPCCLEVSKNIKTKEKPIPNKAAIAVIGMGGRYPQADNVESYWENLRLGRDCISEIPEDRWSLEGFYQHNRSEALAQGLSYSKWGGFLVDFADFDPLFFGISPRDAINLDPQERLFLQSCWEVIEDAGYTKESLATKVDGRVGVFAGVTRTGFALYGPELWAEGKPLFPNTSFSSVANRVSYLLNLHGPSMPIDTMCSSSLTAIHEACEHIRNQGCKMAIAGGVNLYLHPSSYISLSSMSMLSVDGRCGSFGKGANGFVPGEGVGTLLLKPLSKAERDQDHIYAIIRGTSANHGGKTNGYSVPNPKAQGELIRETFDKAGVHARTVSYIEAHGTGTELGDPIEIAGLVHAFQKDTADIGFCALGSVKSNIGHLEAAAGVAGISKIILQMKHGQLVPSLHAQEPNSNIEFEKTPFVLQQELGEWKRPILTINGQTKEYSRIAGISSFGAGGSNAHVVLEEYVEKDANHNVGADVRVGERTAQIEEYSLQKTAKSGVLKPEIKNKGPYLIVLSAKNEDRLLAMAKNLHRYVQNQILNPKSEAEQGETGEPLGSQQSKSEQSLRDGRRQLSILNLNDLAYTLQVGREAMEERLAIIVRSAEELRLKLKGYLEGQNNIEDLYRGHVERNRETIAVFNVDEQFQETIEKWFLLKKYTKVLELWVKGFNLDWSKLYSDAKPRRISAPTYPFSKERYWLFESNVHQSKRIPKPAAPTQSPSDNAQWKPEPIEDNQDWKTLLQRRCGKNLFILYTNEEEKESFTHLLGQLQEAANIATGFRIDTYEVSVQDSYSFNEKPDVIFYLNSTVNLNASHRSRRAELEHLQDCLVKQIGYHRISIYCVFTGEAAPIPSREQEALSEFICSATETSPHYRWKLIDIDSKDGSGNTDQMLLKEWLSEESAYTESGPITEIRYRGSRRLVRQATECTAHQSTSLSNPSQEKRGPYLLEKNWKEKEVNQIEQITIEGDVIILVNEQSHNIAQKWVENQSCRFRSITVVSDGTLKSDHVLQQIDFQDAKSGVEGAKTLLSDSSDISLLVDLSDLYNTPQEQDRDPIGKITFYQGLIRSFPKTTILYVTKGLQHFKSSRMSLAGARFAGLVKMLGAEYDGMNAKWIDIDQSYYDREHGIIEILNHEYGTLSEETEMCYRGGKRLVPYINSRAIAEKEDGDQTARPFPIRETGVYVISGGTSGIGLEIAKYLVERGARKLVLMGITPLPPKEEWQNISQQKGLPSHTKEKLSGLIQLTQAVPQLEIYIGSLTDKSSLVKFFDRVRNELGDIQGVIHGAGVQSSYETPAFIGKKAEAIRKVCEPKVGGLQVLQGIFENDKLDFFVSFSSVAGLIPAYACGTCDYAMANTFLDLFTAYQYHEKKKHYYKVIPWVGWYQTGIVSRIPSKAKDGWERNLNQLGFIPSSNSEGCELFEKAVTLKNRSWVLLSFLDPKYFDRCKKTMLFASDRKQEANKKQPAEVQEIQENSCKLGLKQQQSQPHSAAYDRASSIVKEALAEVLTLNAIDEDESFQTYGLNSVSAMQLTARLEQELRQEVPPQWLIDFPTIRTLSQHLIQQEDFKSEFREETNLKQPAVTEQPHQDNSSSKTKRRHRPISLTSEGSYPEPIAIIGCSGYFPQCMSVSAFWEALDADRCLLEEIPKSRFYWQEIYPDKSCTKWGGFVPDIQGFDANFFGIASGEARLMDPRQRLLLMSVYHTLEDAGYAPESLKKSQTGVFIGAENNEYIQNLMQWGIPLEEGWGHGESMLANRISYFFDFAGPSEVVNTMCSGAAVALHRAVCTLRSGEITQAVVGAANLLLRPEPFIDLSRRGQMSSEVTVNSFGREAGGHQRAEGVATIYLKPLSQAEADGDAIYALVKNTAVNYNGQGGMSIAAPYTPSHINLIQKCYRDVATDPRRVGYIETQGMGSPVTDIPEWDACNRALLGLAKDQEIILAPGTCFLSTLKPMIGHMESASALGALLKIIRSFQTNRIHRILNFKDRSPYLTVEGQPCELATETRDWPRGDCPRLAGLHSYGSGGNNAHILLEEYFRKAPHSPPGLNERFFIPLSAKTKSQCCVQVQQLKDHVCRHAENSLASISHTLQIGRDTMEHRVVFAARNRDHLMQQVEAYLAGNLPEDVFESGVESKPSPLSDRDPLALAEAWAQGKKAPWEGQREIRRVPRLRLPGYPFAKECCWVSGPQSVKHATLAGEETENSGKCRENQVEELLGRLSEEKINFFLNKFTDLNDDKNQTPRNSINREKETVVGTRAKKVVEDSSSRDRIDEIVTEAFANTLQLNRDIVCPRKRFESYDLNSITGTQFVHVLEDKFEIAIPPKWLVEYPTIRELSEAIKDKIQLETMNVCNDLIP